MLFNILFKQIYQVVHQLFFYFSYGNFGNYLLGSILFILFKKIYVSLTIIYGDCSVVVN
jgi:hypothetical protein